jgi:hypothetical protein
MTGLFLALGLGLARHGILQGHRDSDVANLDRGHRYAPSGGLIANLVPELLVGSLPVRQEGCSMEEPIVSRSEVCATRSIACSSDALRASRTCQKTIASTLTGTSAETH